MARIPKKVAERLVKQVAVFQKVLRGAAKRDVNESDTVTIVTDMTARVFGFDKYTEVTSEQAIRGTYCDLAVTLDGKVRYLIEVKAIGLSLKENHIRQVVNYGANHGVPWVVLTNGIVWEIHRIKFERPISHELVCRFDFTQLSSRKTEDQERVFLLCREGVKKSAIEEYHEHVQNVNRFVVGALIQSDSVLSAIRRGLRRLAPDAKVSTDEIKGLLPEVLKREIVEGEDASRAARRVKHASSKTLRRKKSPKGGKSSGKGKEPEASPDIDHEPST